MPLSALRLLVRCGVFLTCAATAAVVAAQPEKSDHPLLSRMPGYQVDAKEVREFDAVQLKDFEVVGKWPGATFPVSFEGRVTTVRYLDAKQATSNLVVYKNYAEAIKSLGGEQLNSGFEATADGVRLGHHLFRIPGKSGAPPTHVLLFINSPQWYRLAFVEPKAMEQMVKAGQLAEEIKSKGFATLYINFDTDKSALKADGEAAVKEIAALLKGDASLKLSIEGHTDNVGSAAANKKLSAQRAASVQTAVAAQGIDAKRLSASGKGAEAPIADNRSEDGRAKNRRVELVKMK
jgi:OmpA-OmpF porin, OOP family